MDGKIKEKGVQMPNIKNIYIPMMEEVFILLFIIIALKIRYKIQRYCWRNTHNKTKIMKYTIFTYFVRKININSYFCIKILFFYIILRN